MKPMVGAKRKDRSDMLHSLALGPYGYLANFIKQVPIYSVWNDHDYVVGAVADTVSNRKNS